MTRKTSWMVPLFLGLLAMTIVMAACNKDDNNNEPTKVTYQLSGNATGAKEIPPVTTDATATLSGTYNSSTNKLEYTINWADLSGPPIMMHFHGPASTTESASPVVDITGFANSTSGSVSGSANLTDEQEGQLLNGLWYYNIHTPNHGAGEIRAQVAVQ